VARSLNSPRFLSLKGIVIVSFLLATLALNFNAFAQPDSKAQAMQQKAQWNMNIASEQYQRGSYKEAELTLLDTIDEYARYLDSSEQNKLNKLLVKVRTSLAEREKIARNRKAGDQLAANSQYGEAIATLNEIKNSRFLTEPERKIVLTNIKDLEKKYSDYKKEVNNLFKESMNLYKAGQLEQARAGFQEVASSGLKISSWGKDSQYYIEAIDKTILGEQTVEVAEVQEPVIEPEAEQAQELIHDEVDVEDELLIESGEEDELETEPEFTEPEILEPEFEQIDDVEVEPLQQAPEILEPESIEVVDSREPDVIQTQQPDEPQGGGYVQVIERRRSRLISYTNAIVVDAKAKAQKNLQLDKFNEAKQAVAKAMSVVNKNKLLLGDELYKEHLSRLTELDIQISDAKGEYAAAQQRQRQKEVEQLYKKHRQTAETRRTERIKDHIERARAFEREQRYEEALGQLEQVLAIDPLNDTALFRKQTLEDTVRWREQVRIQKENNEKEIEMLLSAERRSVPYPYDDAMTYPRDWKELSEKRKIEGRPGQSPEDAAVYKQLDQTVDLTEFNEDMSFADAIDILRNSVSPPLIIVVMWGELEESAFIDSTEPIKMSGQGLSAIRLRTGLERLLQAVGGGLADLAYNIKDGIITISTEEALPENYITIPYDITEIVSAPADFSTDTMGGSGSSGGGRGGGGSSGGSSRGGSSGGSSRGGSSGGSSGGRSGGGSSGGGGGRSGGGGGGSSGGGSSGDSTGSYLVYERLYDFMYTIQQTIEPDSWEEAGGEGRISVMGGIGKTMFSIYQTPEIHEKIAKFIDEAKKMIGDQVAIEARFLLVNENFLQDIGFDADINFRLGNKGKWQGNLELGQSSYDAVVPTSTTISSSLGGLSSTLSGNPALEMTKALTYGTAMDDLQVTFILRATEMHSNSKLLSAPRITVMNGESGAMSVFRERSYVSNTTFNTEVSAAGDATALGVSFWQNEIGNMFLGIELSVTPTIMEGNKYVLLRLDIYREDLLDLATGSVTAGDFTNEPITNTFDLPELEITSLQTRVCVPDKGTVLLGGLTLTAEKTLESGVPILSKLPILGRLFSNRSEVKDKQILLILIKPTILLKEESEADAIAAME